MFIYLKLHIFVKCATNLMLLLIEILKLKGNLIRSDGISTIVNRYHVCCCSVKPKRSITKAILVTLNCLKCSITVYMCSFSDIFFSQSYDICGKEVEVGWTTSFRYHFWLCQSIKFYSEFWYRKSYV